MLDHYYILGIPHNSTDAEIKAAFHKKAMVYHPDKLQKKLKNTEKTENEINIIKRIYTKKYDEIKLAYTTLTEGREEYDKYLLDIKTQITEPYEIKPDMKIEKTELVDNYSITKFNEEFTQKHQKIDYVEKNITKAYEKLLVERENIEYNYEKLESFDIHTFNDNFFKDVELDSSCHEESTLAEYDPHNIYDYKDKYELTESSIIDTNILINISDLVPPVQKITDDRKIVDLSKIKAGDLCYEEYLIS